MTKKHYKERKTKKSAKREQRILERRKKQRIRNIGIILVIICVVVPLSVYAYLNLPEDETEPVNNENIGINIGQTAPDFTLIDTDGNSFSLKDYRGNIVVLDFMAMDCPPCRMEMEHLNEVYENYTDKEVRILSIDVKDWESEEDLDNFKDYYGCDWQFAAHGGSVGTTYETQYIPTFYIIDKQGSISYKNAGLTDYSTLSSELDKLV